MLSQEDDGRQYDEYGQPLPPAKQLTFEQQKAELKRKIMTQPAKKPKYKKQKKDTVYNPECKVILFYQFVYGSA